MARVRTLSTQRLGRRLGRMSAEELQLVVEGYSIWWRSRWPAREIPALPPMAADPTPIASR